MYSAFSNIFAKVSLFCIMFFMYLFIIFLIIVIIIVLCIYWLSVTEGSGLSVAEEPLLYKNKAVNISLDTICISNVSYHKHQSFPL